MTNMSLWKDIALLELNIAVLHSFTQQGVTIVDHHTASDQFMVHYNKETELRGYVPSDWVWITPPMSGAVTSVFHQEMLNFFLKPAFLTMTSPWKSWPITSVRRAATSSLLPSNAASAKKPQCDIPIVLAYGSETGKAETFARQLRALLVKVLGATPKVTTLDQLDREFFSDSNDRILLVITSTFGTGDAPHNAVELAAWLKAQTETEKARVAGRLYYSVLGLCNSTYPTFNAFGKQVDALLNTFGGTELHPLGVSDEFEGQEIAFNQWREAVIRGIGKLSGSDLTLTSSTTPEAVYLTLQAVAPEVALQRRKGDSDKAGQEDYSQNRPYIGTVTANNTLFKDEDRSTHHLILDVANYARDTKLSVYAEGDHVAVLAENDPRIVRCLLGRLGISPEEANTYYTPQEGLAADEVDIPAFFSVPRTPAELLRSHLEISAAPTSSVLATYARFANDEKDKLRLTELAEHSHIYNEWIQRTNPNVLTTLGAFASVKLPLAVFLQVTPAMKPRFYSISSSPSLYPKEIHLTVAAVQYNSDDGSKHRGLCSNYLGNMDMSSPSEQRTVRMWIKPAPQFHLPTDPKQPIIMVGPGTGIAPFRGFWQAAAKATERKSLLFFGCRTLEDQLYAAETAEAVIQKQITQLHVAHSRVSKEQKVYVQHRLQEQAEQVYRLLNSENARIYVCGDLGMSIGVEDTIKQIAQMIGNHSATSAQEWIGQLKASGRYSTDVFGAVLHTREQPPVAAPTNNAAPGVAMTPTPAIAMASKTQPAIVDQVYIPEAARSRKRSARRRATRKAKAKAKSTAKTTSTVFDDFLSDADDVSLATAGPSLPQA